MSANVALDQWVVIKIEGMHCHKCEAAIQKSLLKNPGVHEVEVDFNSGQASVLFDRSKTTSAQLVESVNAAGYRAGGFFLGQQADSNDRIQRG